MSDSYKRVFQSLEWNPFKREHYTYKSNNKYLQLVSSSLKTVRLQSTFLCPCYWKFLQIPTLPPSWKELRGTGDEVPMIRRERFSCQQNILIPALCIIHSTSWPFKWSSSSHRYIVRTVFYSSYLTSSSRRTSSISRLWCVGIAESENSNFLAQLIAWKHYLLDMSSDGYTPLNDTEDEDKQEGGKLRIHRILKVTLWTIVFYSQRNADKIHLYELCIVR